MSRTLRVGDKVEWRGGWGREAPTLVTVSHIEITDACGSKYGLDTDEVSWDSAGRIVVDLDNGHWAYGSQISPVTEANTETEGVLFV